MTTKFPFPEVLSYLKSIEAKGEKHEKILERVEQVQDVDHKDFKEMERRLSHVEVELKAMAELISKIPNQTRDRVAEANLPVIEGADNLTKAIEAAEIVPIDKETVKNQKKHWWKFRKGG